MIRFTHPEIVIKKKRYEINHIARFNQAPERVFMPIRVDKCTSNITLSLDKVKYFSKGKLRILDLLIWFHNKNPLVFPTCNKLAEMVGLTPNYVSMLTTELQEDGFISKQYRHMHSNIYSIANELYNFWNRCLLSRYLPATRHIVLSVAMMIMPYQTQIVDEYIKRIYLEGCRIEMKFIIPQKLLMNDAQIEQLNCYDGTIVDFAWLKFLEKKESIPQDAHARYFLGICRNKQKIVNNKSVESILKSGIAESPVVAQIPENERPTNDSVPAISPILAPPPANKPTIAEVTQYVSDNFGLKVKANRPTTIIGSQRQNIVEWENSITAHVTSIEEQGLGALASIFRDILMPSIKKPAVSIETTGNSDDDIWFNLQQCVDDNCDEFVNFI